MPRFRIPRIPSIDSLTKQILISSQGNPTLRDTVRSQIQEADPETHGFYTATRNSPQLRSFVDELRGGVVPGGGVPGDVVSAFGGRPDLRDQDLRLPTGFGFGELADYEEARRRRLGGPLSQLIGRKRGMLAESLGRSGQATFERANPFIMQDLQRRGLFTSPSARATAQSDVLGDIERENQQFLRQFDVADLSTQMQVEQDALDAALNLRRSGLENRLGVLQSSADRNLAESLARRQGRNQLWGSLIGAGGNILGGYLGGRK